MNMNNNCLYTYNSNNCSNCIDCDYCINCTNCEYLKYSKNLYNYNSFHFIIYIEDMNFTKNKIKSLLDMTIEYNSQLISISKEEIISVVNYMKQYIDNGNCLSYKIDEIFLYLINFPCIVHYFITKENIPSYLLPKQIVDFCNKNYKK